MRAFANLLHTARVSRRNVVFPDAPREASESNVIPRPPQQSKVYTVAGLLPVDPHVFRTIFGLAVCDRLGRMKLRSSFPSATIGPVLAIGACTEQKDTGRSRSCYGCEVHPEATALRSM